MLIIFLATLITFNVYGGALKFPDVTKTTFTKNSCSPVGTLNDATVLLAKLPAEIAWGQPLPICGLIKSSEYMDITVRILNKETTLIPGVIGSSIDLVPTLSSFPNAAATFKKQGQIYFNANAFSDERNPPPGNYTVELETYDGKSKTSTSVSIRAEGKKYEFAQALSHIICEQDAFVHFKKYFDLMTETESCRDPLPHSVEKVRDEKALEKQAQTEWKKSWERHSKNFSRFPKKDLQKWASQHEVAPISHVVDGLITKTCPHKKDETYFSIHLRMLLHAFSWTP